MEHKKRYNLRDVAARAGVSVATVSRVLNQSKSVSSPTRERVGRAMQDLRFVPSAAARAINSGRSRMVAALLPTLDNSIYARVVDGLENKLAEYGLSLIVAQTGDDADLELERARQLIEIGAEGLILAGITRHPDLSALIDHIRIPTIAVSYFDPKADTPTVGYDNAEAAIIALSHLRELGHHEISVLHGTLANNDRTRARKRALDAQADGLELQFQEVGISIEGGCTGVAEILEQRSTTTAILCFSDVLAMGALNELKRRDISVPDDISVMGIEDLPGSKFLSPALTSVRLQVQAMGERAADAMAGWLEEDRMPEPVHMPAKLIHRESTARR